MIYIGRILSKKMAGRKNITGLEWLPSARNDAIKRQQYRINNVLFIDLNKTFNMVPIAKIQPIFTEIAAGKNLVITTRILYTRTKDYLRLYLPLNPKHGKRSI